MPPDTLRDNAQQQGPMGAQGPEQAGAEGPKSKGSPEEATAKKFGIKVNNVRAYNRMSSAALLKEARYPYLYRSTALIKGCREYVSHLLQTKHNLPELGALVAKSSTRPSAEAWAAAGKEQKSRETAEAMFTKAKVGAGDKKRLAQVWMKTTALGKVPLVVMAETKADRLGKTDMQGKTLLKNYERVTAPLKPKPAYAKVLRPQLAGLSGQLISESANAYGYISQQNIGACGVTIVIAELAASQPADYVRIVSDLVETGVAPIRGTFKNPKTGKVEQQKITMDESVLKGKFLPNRAADPTKPNVQAGEEVDQRTTSLRIASGALLQGTNTKRADWGSGTKNKKFNTYDHQDQGQWTDEQAEMLRMAFGAPILRVSKGAKAQMSGANVVLPWDKLWNTLKSEVAASTSANTLLRWGGGNHYVLIQKVAAAGIEYYNPWGKSGVTSAHNNKGWYKTKDAKGDWAKDKKNNFVWKKHTKGDNANWLSPDDASLGPKRKLIDASQGKEMMPKAVYGGRVITVFVKNAAVKKAAIKAATPRPGVFTRMWRAVFG